MWNRWREPSSGHLLLELSDQVLDAEVLLLPGPVCLEECVEALIYLFEATINGVETRRDDCANLFANEKLECLDVIGSERHGSTLARNEPRRQAESTADAESLLTDRNILVELLQAT